MQAIKPNSAWANSTAKIGPAHQGNNECCILSTRITVQPCTERRNNKVQVWKSKLRIPWCNWPQSTHSWSPAQHQSHPWHRVESAWSDAGQTPLQQQHVQIPTPIQSLPTYSVLQSLQRKNLGASTMPASVLFVLGCMACGAAASAQFKSMATTSC